MLDIEIPYEEDRTWRYRFWEILPGLISWTILLLPFILGIFAPAVFAVYIIAFLLLWFIKAIGLNVRSIQGHRVMHQQAKMDWGLMLDDLEAGELLTHPNANRPKWHSQNIARLTERPLCMKPSEVIHVMMIATYNESRDTLEPTVKSVLSGKYDMKKVILVMAYEGRDGAQAEQSCLDLVKEYGSQFMHAMAVKHPLTPKEVRGKGGNITYAGRQLQKLLESKNIDPSRVVVTTLDADNRPHPKYMAALTYTYCSTEDPRYVSYQPIPMYTNNIWDAPSPMRVIATGNSFWNVVMSMRPHVLRNFSSHAQGMHALIDTDFWSTRTIVEDGHQFWRTYFRYDGRHEVYPIFMPIYQDAVLSDTYKKTLKAQFIQLRRWAWGASDVSYIASKGFRRDSKVPRTDMIAKMWRLLEGHVSWATASLLLAFGSLVPVLVNPSSYTSNQLPHTASILQNIALTGILVTLFLSFSSLPPKPERYKRHRTIFMVLQWVLLPVTSILYNSLAALYSQTRLMFGRYIGKFDVTHKAVKK